MSTSRLYDTMLALFNQHLPTILESQRTNLVLVISGLMHTQRCHLADIARALPLDPLQESKEQRIRRLLDNHRITRATHYRPFVVAYLTPALPAHVDISLDRVILNDTFTSIGFRRRAVPVA